MMHFEQPARDNLLLAELRELGLVTPDVIERIDSALDRPESGTLNGFLLAGADLISEPAWLSWLIRHHGCHRFSRVAWTPSAPEGPGAEGNLPYSRRKDGDLLVAVLRPDRWEETSQRLAPARLQRAAATLAEIRDGHRAWRRGGS